MESWLRKVGWRVSRWVCRGVVALTLLLCVGSLAACKGTGLELGYKDATVGASIPEGREGTWRGSVTYVKDTVYGSSGGVEPMLDVTLSEDGTCTVEPLEAHSDLPSGDGTWEDLGDTVILNLGSTEVELRTIEDGRLEGDASDFGVRGYEKVEFDYLG